MLKYNIVKSLIGKEVKAIGSCGMTKNQEVIGILSQNGSDWVVTVNKGSGFALPCSVYYQTIQENK